MYAAIELLYGISVSFYQNSDFKQILEQFGLKLIDMCVEILHESDQTFITKKKNRILIGRTLSIIHILMEKENV